MKKLYETLGVEETADAEQLKAGYRRAAQRAHPDREGGGEEQFNAVKKAFEALSDPELRAHYDRYGTLPGEEKP